MIKDYVAFDLETTGLSVESNQIIEIGALRVRDGKVVDRFIEFVKPDKPISRMITNITGITNAMVADARNTEAIIQDFVSFCKEDVLVGHNIMFDYQFSKKYANMYGFPFEKRGIDTLKIARKVHKDFESRSLNVLCDHYCIDNKAAHRAYHDALATAKLYQCLAHYFEANEPKLFEPVQLQYRPRKAQPVTKKQLAFMENLCQQRGISLPSNMDKMTRSEASRYIDHILSRKLCEREKS